MPKRFFALLTAALLMALPLQAAQISRQHSSEIQNGNPVNADWFNDEYNTLYNESNSQDTRITNIESSNITLTGVKTFSSNPKLNGIDENTAGAGVTVDGHLIKDGYGNHAAIRTTISSVDTGTEVITTAAAHGLSTGDAIRLRATSGSILPGGTSGTTTYYARAVSTTTLTLHPSSSDASGNTNTVNLTSSHSGTVQIVIAPASPAEYDMWMDAAGLKYRLDSSTKTVATTDSIGLPIGYHGSAAPVYSSASQFTVAYIRERNSADDGDIKKATSTTVDISTTGLNGVAQSANLTGTVATTSGSATVTGTSTTFTTDFQVGDVICASTAGCRRITAIGSNTSITVESNYSSTASGQTYKRGGEAPSTWYNLYAVTDGTTPGLLLSTRNVAAGDTLADLPSGYTKSRQLAFAVRNDSSSNIIPFQVFAGWPDRPFIAFRGDFYRSAGTGTSTTQILTSGTQTSFTAVSAASYVPPISRACRLHTSGVVASSWFALRPTGSGLTVGQQIFNSTNPDTQIVEVGLDSSQQFDYLVQSGVGMAVTMSVLGFTVTEVP